MRVLIDECAPKALKNFLMKRGHNSLTVQEAGWAGKQNGELLDLAEADFDVLFSGHKPTLPAKLARPQNRLSSSSALQIAWKTSESAFPIRSGGRENQTWRNHPSGSQLRLGVEDRQQNRPTARENDPKPGYITIAPDTTIRAAGGLFPRIRFGGAVARMISMPTFAPTP